MADQITEYALPGVLAEIAALTTPDIAVAIARAHGGGRLYIPRDVKRGHPLARLIGVPAARLICRRMGNDRYDIPAARTYLRWYDARRLKAHGKTDKAIAKELGVGRSQVVRLLRGYVAPDPAETGDEDAPRSERCAVCGRGHSAARHHRPDPRQGVLALDVTGA